ncbi:restriction endonuclease subunit S [Staphylococcus simulans]|uniref:restriction endonuclease subunit S n=1 Tax=Staphylococcus simulans TaxID=1286 RepID=UPI0021D33224|nr:restriction endonuclease subunit S [Staphylococcus simulans]UXR47711.1 restriction endonuclease subunit S [Staphylococcus simulans]
MSKQNQHKPKVPELRFPEFSGEWEEKKLNDLGKYKKSYTFSRAKEGSGKYKHVHYGDIHTKLPSLIKEASILPSITEEKNFSVVEKGDLIFADASEDYEDLGKATMVDFDDTNVVSGLHTHLFRPSENIISRFLIYYTETERYKRHIKREGNGISVLGISKTNLGKLKTFLPSMQEQQKIGNFFSKLDRQIALQEKKLALLEEQKKGYMQKIFSQELRFKDENGNEYPKWKEANLEAVLKMKEGLRRGPFGGALKKEIFIEEGYAVYEQANAIYDNQTFRYFIDENKFNEMKNFSVKADDIIMSCSGTIGKLSLIPKNYKEGIINQALIRFRVSEKLNSLYFLYYMKSGMMQRKILKSNPGSAIVNLIPVKDLKKINLKVPSIEEQEKISNFLHNLDSLLAKKILKIKMMKNRKDSFLQKMFL